MEYKRILLTGASGKLGGAILRLGIFPNLLTPAHSELDITDFRSVDSFLASNPPDAVIHCAAMARMHECEKNPASAILANTVGTANLALSLLHRAKNSRVLHLSTDAVYACTRGGYSELDETAPCNLYGWSKLGAERAISLLPNHCIIRTSFFDPNAIPFADAPTDAYSSKMPMGELVSALRPMLTSSFIGTINIGARRQSLHEIYSPYKPALKRATLAAVNKSSPAPIAKDASLDCSLWEKIRNG